MANVVIVYDTRTGSTEKAAREILEGVKESGASVEMKRVDDVTVDDIKKAKGVILGSPNINDNYSGKMRDFVEKILPQGKPYDKAGAAFGTYKWNHDNIKRLEDDMRWKGVNLVTGGVNVHRHDSGEAIKKLRELGKTVGMEALKK